MDMVKILHMAHGLGERSYAQNSRLTVVTVLLQLHFEPHIQFHSFVWCFFFVYCCMPPFSQMFQKGVIESVMDITLSSAMEACAVETVPATVSIADLGCCSGPNTLFVIENIIRAVCEMRREAMRKLPEFAVFLNDLPSNDFNTLFSLVPEFVLKLKDEHDVGILVSVAGVPGSFYGRLFSSCSLHFLTSFTSLQWLSQVSGVQSSSIALGQWDSILFHRSLSKEEIPSTQRRSVPDGTMCCELLTRNRVHGEGLGVTPHQLPWVQIAPTTSSRKSRSQSYIQLSSEYVDVQKTYQNHIIELEEKNQHIRRQMEEQQERTQQQSDAL